MERDSIDGDNRFKNSTVAEPKSEERKLFMQLKALSGNLVVLFGIDTENGRYTEFRPSSVQGEPDSVSTGSDFFGTVYEKHGRTVHPDDQALFNTKVTKENVLATIDRDGIFLIDYRLMREDLPSYVRLKAAMLEYDGKRLLIIGLLDEDAQIRQEREHTKDLAAAKQMATVDSLTGVKNKHAYEEWEAKLNAEIRQETPNPFAVVVCDINDLKPVNDLYGHKEGDACIRKACAKICSIFSHSPVFRIGGDEFAVLLTGEDYGCRTMLMEQMNALPADHSEIRLGETISAGMAEYDKNLHDSVQDVFEEADKAMYARKQYLKENVLAKKEIKPESDAESEIIPVINARKQILIVDDEEANREILGSLLQKDYDILYASGGKEALEILRSRKDEIDLVLLDLLMTDMNGREVISQMQFDEELMSVPVIILTVDAASELDCLKIGAADFILKPFPDIEIVKARIARSIELSEDRDLIRHTERDKLTGLLNKEYFFRYVNRLDHIYGDKVLDAVAFDVNRFHSVNKDYGRQFCDLLLHNIGISIRKLARKTDGISCRLGGDTFLLYCPYRDDYEQLLKEFLHDTFSGNETENKVSLRIGIFRDAQLEPDIELRFSRARVAAESVKDNPGKICGVYDSAI